MTYASHVTSTVLHFNHIFSQLVVTIKLPMIHSSILIINCNQLYHLLPVHVPPVPDVLPDLVDHDPHHSDTHKHGQEDNVVRYFSSVEENVVEGDDEETKTTCRGKTKTIT